MRPILESILWVAIGGFVGVVGCRTDFIEEGACSPMTLVSVPVGTFPTTGLGSVGEGAIEITEDDVRLAFEHEDYGQIDAVYRRVGEIECHHCEDF